MPRIGLVLGIVAALAGLCPTGGLALELVAFTPSVFFTLSPSGGNIQQGFGTVRVESDSPTGWVLYVQSSQGGTLQHATLGAAIPYSLVVDGVQVDSLAGGGSVAALSATAPTCPPPGGCTFSVQATLLGTATAGKPAGNYTDTLTFTVINQ